MFLWLFEKYKTVVNKEGLNASLFTTTKTTFINETHTRGQLTFLEACNKIVVFFFLVHSHILVHNLFLYEEPKEQLVTTQMKFL